jgi:3-oxoacyl-[acyl-carrier protein] reductase
MNIIVTGASKGIGAEIVQVLDKTKEYNIIAIARSSGLLNELASKCNNLLIISGDLADDNQFQYILTQIIEEFSEIDILINNVGILINKPFTALTTSDWTDLLNTNLISIVNLTRELLPHLTRSKHAHVVNISSMAGFQGSVKFPGLSGYSVTKAALNALTECLATEYTDSQISFNSLALGAIQTEMFNQAFPKLKAPLSPTEIAEFIADFAINNARFFNGKIIPVAVSNP